MILFRTMLNRSLWMNPLSDVMGGWWIYETNPSTSEFKLTTECIENLMLFIPFSALLMWFMEQKGRLSVFSGQVPRSYSCSPNLLNFAASSTFRHISAF